jgi:glutamine amidotransferase
MKITIVDYGLGNLWSVRNAFEFMGIDITVSSDPSVVAQSQILVLPGVGNFGTGMKNLHSLGLVDALNEAVIQQGVPILGICLGMQLFADESEEAPGIKGLGWISGKVSRFKKQDIRLPHMGFNTASFTLEKKHKFIGMHGEALDFYFVHSYYFIPQNKESILAHTTYGVEFVSAVTNNTIIGVQFHPEKSQSNGLRLIANFLKFSYENNYS